jgi:hypothetical protein
MNTNNIFQKLQTITKYLSIASFSLGLFNTTTNFTTINSLRTILEEEKIKNTNLIAKLNETVNKNINDNKIEELLTNNIEINNNKLEKLNSKIDEMIKNNSSDNFVSVSEIDNSIKEINKELVQIINKIDETLNNNNFIGTDIFNILQSHYASFNFFQSLAITHLSAIIFIILSLISLISMYFGDYLIEKFNISNKYPRIHKYIQLRRKFQRYYLILDLTIIFVMLIILAILNIILFVKFTL